MPSERDSDMQTAAAILISLGTEMANTGQISSSEAGATGISFARSFDESAAQIMKTLPQMAGNEVSASDVDCKAGVQVKNGGTVAFLTRPDVKTETDAGSSLASGADTNKSLSVFPDAKVPTTALEKEMAKLTKSGAVSTQGKLKPFTSDAIQMEGTDAQAASDNTEAPVLGFSTTISTEETADAPGEQVIASQADAAVLPTSSAQPCEEISSVQNQKQIPVRGDKQDDLSNRAAKGHDAVVETEETTKKEKTGKISESLRTKAEPQTQVATEIPVLAIAVDGTQSGANACQVLDDPQPSTTSAVANSRIELRAGTEHKPGKIAVAPGLPDVEGGEPLNSSLLDGPASPKISTEGLKTGGSPAIPDGKLNGKSQTPVVAIATPDLSHIGVAGVGSKSDHAATAGPHGTGDSMHLQDVHTGVGAPPSTMDASTSMDVAHKTLHATPATLEVGFADGSRGWLKIRAEMAERGGVNASLSAASSSGQDILHKELPSLTAYLQSEHIAVNRVIVQPAPAIVSDPRAFAGGMNHEGRDQSRQSGGQGAESRENASRTVSSRLEQNRFSGVTESRGDESLSSFPYLRGGSWLSVRA